MELLLNTDDRTIQDSLTDLISTAKSIKVLSPYLTKNKALDQILERKDFKLVLILGFNPELPLMGAASIDLNLVKQLISNGQVVYYNPELHSKIYITDESLILGSANFTYNGLVRRKESAILVKKEMNPKFYSDCLGYFESILKSSKMVTTIILDKIIEVIDDQENTWEDKSGKLSEILLPDYVRNSIFVDYDLKYYYPKTLHELQNGLKFDLIDHEELEYQYKAKFPRAARDKNEIIHFIKVNLYEKNNGYNINAKINDCNSTVNKWYRDNSNEFRVPLKSYRDFAIYRSIELLNLYKASFDIQPATGFFAAKFNYLKSKGLLDENFFLVKLSEFEEQWRLNLLKQDLNEIDVFIEQNHRIPDRNARMNIKKMERNKTLTKDQESKLRYEGRLRDRLYQTQKKYKNDGYMYASMKEIIEQYFNKWDWPL